VIALALLALLGSVSESAQCRERYDALQFRSAVEICQRAIASAPREQLEDLYRMLAVSLGTIGDTARSQAAFVSLLALDADFQLPDTVSPKLRALLAVARTRSAGARVSVRLVEQGPAFFDAPVRIKAEIADGPAQPVRILQVRAGAARDQLSRTQDALAVELRPPFADNPLPVEVQALDDFGGPLTTSRLEVKLQARHAPRPWVLAWPVWSGAAIGLAAAGISLGFVSQATDKGAATDLYADRAAADLSLARKEAVGANVALGVAGALAVGAVILFATEHRGSP
jgi:hypothetical protein